MEKRGAVELQFNWIFVVVAGGLILALVVSFILMNAKSADKTDADQTLRSIKTYLAGTASVRGKQTKVELNNLEMTYSDQQIAIGASTRDALMLFGPRKVFGRQLFIWTRDISVPFLVSNIAYMTTEQVKYILIYDPLDKKSMRLMKEINDSFSNASNYAQIPISAIGSVRDENNYMTVFSFLGMTALPLSQNIKGNVIGVEIIPDENNLTGRINFYDYKTASYAGDSYYIGKEMATGAIVSGDYYNYDNISKQVFTRIKAMSEILGKRAQLLNPGSSSDLSIRYETAYQRLSDITAIMDTIIKEPSQVAVKSQELARQIEELSSQNKKIFVRSGATIY